MRWFKLAYSGLLRSPSTCFSDSWLLENSMALNHTDVPQDERLPHYLQDGDPFASKLSWEADLVAGFYLTIIGKLFCAKAAHRKLTGWCVDFAQRFWHLRRCFEWRWRVGGRQRWASLWSSTDVSQKRLSAVFISRDKYSLNNPNNFDSKWIYLETISYFGCLGSRFVF